MRSCACSKSANNPAMKPLPLYFVETLFCSGVLLAFYRLLLVRKVGFGCCRRFLLAAVALSVLLPALDIPLYPARTVVYPLPLIGVEPSAVPALTTTEAEAMRAAASTAAFVDWPRIVRFAAGTLCLAATCILLALFAGHLTAIRRLRRRSRLTDCGDYWLAEDPGVATPFSFLRTVFLGEGLTGSHRDMVLCHEASHVRHRHSVERIVMELMRCLFWFNPFVWIASRWLREVQEWEADSDVLAAGYDLTEYRTVLFRQLFGYDPDIACGLNRSFTKTRFAMMTQFKERRFAFVRLGAAIPVVAGMMLLCSFTVRTADAPAKRTHPVTEVRIGRDGLITLNGRPIECDSLAAHVAAERRKLSEADQARMEVRLVAEPEQTMADVEDLKQKLREARALRVSYAMPSKETDVQRFLPPKQGMNGKVRFVEMPVIKERNRFPTIVSGSGAVTVGQPGRQRAVAPDELPAMVEAFVLNESDDPAGPEKEMKEIPLCDGTTGRYPVSEGIVQLMVERTTPYAVYIEVQQALQRGFARARDAVAKRWLGAPSYDALSEADRQVVDRAVPLKVFEAEYVAAE